MTDSNNISHSAQPNCGFPTTQLRAYRRQLVEELKAIEKTAAGLSDFERRVYAATLLSIDRLALDHADITDCKCWIEAVAKSAQVA